MAREHTVSAAGSQKESTARLMWDAALAGLGHQDASLRLAARLDGHVEWPALLRESRANRLTPFVYAGLTRGLAKTSGVPAECLREARRETLRAGIRLSRLEQACVEVVDHATGAGIPLLVLKGVALAATVYPPGIPRPMDDIDLLVRENDRDGLAEILRTRGYRNDLRGEEDFFPPSREFSLDVHTAPMNVTRIPARRALWPVSFAELWGRHRTFRLVGTPIQTLGPLDTAIHLAVHAVHHHGLAGSLWMADLLQCMEKWPLPANDLAAMPASVRRSLWYCLEAMTIRGLPSPDLQDRVRPRSLYAGERRLVAAASRGTLPEAVRYAFTLCGLAGWRHKLLYLRQILFPHSDAFRTGFSDAGNKKTGWGTIWRLGLGVLRSLALHLMGGPSPTFTRHSAPRQDHRTPGLDARTTRADTHNTGPESACLPPRGGVFRAGQSPDRS
ncbi:MAG: nucleotidyltransferase family protein [candidate division NC10 bacterium]|nr:nucleotidyltransferase family protein [candidate division NC10 bacterium]